MTEELTLWWRCERARSIASRMSWASERFQRRDTWRKASFVSSGR